MNKIIDSLVNKIVKLKMKCFQYYNNKYYDYNNYTS